MLARHVSDLISPSSGAFCTSCIRRLWYVVIRVLLDTSSRYKVTAGRVYIRRFRKIVFTVFFGLSVFVCCSGPYYLSFETLSKIYSAADLN